MHYGRRKRARRVEEKEEQRTYTFAFVPKYRCVNSPFNSAAFEGCKQRAKELGNVKCECIESDDFTPEQRKRQELIIANLTERGLYDGMGIAVRKADDVVDAINDAIDAGIPVVTFGGDSPKSRRAAYIGTDNVGMGRELAKVLKQIRPEGGKYAFVSALGTNILERERAFREALEGTTWSEIGDGMSPIIGSANGTLAVERMWTLAENRSDLTALIPLTGSPMNKGVQWKEFATEFRDRVALVSVDWTEKQMDLLGHGYAHGLVGQLPFQMGQDIASTLYKLQDGAAEVQSEILGTNLIEILRVPIVLPQLDVDYNYLGNLTILGYILFAIVAILAIGCSIWTFLNRNARVVKASQPMFLYLLCMGVLIFGSTIIPLGIDDENHSLASCNIACMSVPWLFSVGFVLVFSVLFSKTWRVNRLFHNPNKFKRIKVTMSDVIQPLILLMTVNVIVLVCWTALSPLVYVREYGIATDLWNRPTTSTGICRSDSDRRGNALPYVILIFLIDLGALVMANVQAYIARDIETEFSESKWIALVLASILQAAAIGLPIIFLSRNDPIVHYIFSVVLIFVLSVVILLLIFVPKYVHHKEWVAKRAAKDRKKKENSQAITTDTFRCDGTDGLRVMVRQSVYVKPGAKVPSQGNTHATKDLVEELEDDYDHALSEEDRQTAAKEHDEIDPTSVQHDTPEEDSRAGSNHERESVWQDNKSTSTIKRKSHEQESGNASKGGGKWRLRRLKTC